MTAVKPRPSFRYFGGSQHIADRIWSSGELADPSLGARQSFKLTVIA